MTRIDLPAEKKVGHLTLLRQGRPISAKEFNALAFDERLAMIRAASGRRKYDLLLEVPDAAPLVRKLPAQDLFLLIKEMGGEAVPHLFECITPSQFVSFIDLDCWQADRLDAEKTLDWLNLLAGAGEEKVLAVLQDCDFDLLVLLLRKLIEITRGPEDITDEEELAAALQRDGGYTIECRDSENAKAVFGLLDVLYRLDQTFYLQLMASVRWEHDAMLEEEAYRLHTGRLQDQGFPDPHEALAIYTWLDPETFDPADHRKLSVTPIETETEAPGFVLSLARAGNLLAEVLAAGITQETAWELTYLLNKAMSADRVDVGDVDQVQSAMVEVYHYLNLALEYLADDDSQRAAELFDGVYLQTLFRLGYSLTLRLKRRAAVLLDSPIAPYLDGPFRALVDGLSRSKPRLFEGVEDETRGGERSFASNRDLRLAEAWLERVETQQRLFVDHFPFDLPTMDDIDLAGCAPDDPDDLVLSDFFLTALANRILERPFAPEPLATEDLILLYGRICREGKIEKNLRLETLQWLEGLEPGGGAFGDYCLDLWEEDFCEQSPENLDPRYFSGLLVRLKEKGES